MRHLSNQQKTGKLICFPLQIFCGRRDRVIATAVVRCSSGMSKGLTTQSAFRSAPASETSKNLNNKLSA